MSDSATLLALAERCEQAAGPDRGWDAEIAVALFGGNVIYGLGTDQWRRIEITGARRMNHPLPPYTASLDAAVTLVPEGWTWGRFHSGAVECMTLNGPGNSILFERGEGISTALALCAAALRARAAAYE